MAPELGKRMEPHLLRKVVAKALGSDRDVDVEASLELASHGVKKVALRAAESMTGRDMQNPRSQSGMNVATLRRGQAVKKPWANGEDCRVRAAESSPTRGPVAADILAEALVELRPQRRCKPRQRDRQALS